MREKKTSQVKRFAWKKKWEREIFFYFFLWLFWSLVDTFGWERHNSEATEIENGSSSSSSMNGDGWESGIRQIMGVMAM